MAILVMNLFSFGYAVSSEVAWSPKPTSDFVASVGYIGPALSSNCLSTRNPILEPTCLTDLPGGYCYHFACGMVNPPN